jgi:hypothetical protein
VNYRGGNAAAKELFRGNVIALSPSVLAQGTHAFTTNQIASKTIATTIAPQTTGVTLFELPLRGESFGAWL